MGRTLQNLRSPPAEVEADLDELVRKQAEDRDSAFPAEARERRERQAHMNLDALSEALLYGGQP